MTFVAGLRLPGLTAPWALDGPMDGGRATHHRAECSEPSHQQGPKRRLSSRCTSSDRRWVAQCQGHRTPRRSEEHTSELQSLMRISYAVFCLNKKILKQQFHKLRSRGTYRPT